MKARSLISCILLSIFIILLLSMGAQATEYKEVNTEVNASNITEHIENGEDVNLTDCRIVGELNVSKINLETVPNPKIDKFLKEGYTREQLINSLGLKENLSVIKSNIIITNSTFENDLDFSNVLFNNSADFNGATFNNSVYFSETTFNNSVDFSEATFNNSAYFSGATFNNSADFQVPDTSENIFTDGKMCSFFMKSYNDESRYTDANNIYYNYRKTYQNNKDLADPSKWIDVLSWITCGYGTRISHTLIFSVGIIIFFACLYRQSTTVFVINSKNKRKPVKVNWEEPKIYRLSDTTEKKSIISFFDALYFSLMIFTTLGSEWSPRDNYRKWVALEGVIGYIMLGIFLSTIGNILIKP